MKILKKITLSLFFLVCFWEGVVWLFNIPSYIFPSPIAVAQSFVENFSLLVQNAAVTILEAIVGFILAGIFGFFAAIIVSYFSPLEFFFLPLLLISQALPTFAIAPLIVMWFGYDISAKIIITILMLFFPITNSCYDGLRNTNPVFLDLAKTIRAKKKQIFWRIRIPSALKSLGTGLKLSASYAPMGAVIGEWVGANQGLGFLILNANMRMNIPLMFAALIVLIAFTLLFFFSVDKLVRYFIKW